MNEKNKIVEVKEQKIKEEVIEKINEEKKIVEKILDKKEEKINDKKEKKKEKALKNVIEKKEESVARGINLHISKKHAMYICSFIKDKKIDNAIDELEKVTKLKKVIPFKGEIPHRKGDGIMSGRYPVKAAGLFINVLKGLKGNVLVNEMELENTRIYFASANLASRPRKSRGRQAKRTNVVLKAKEFGGK